ncbi:MAG TPA: hypothetical protein VFU07_07285 [Candidatus Lumbricidophila sp.]|nr:hypothetical protein [Candidatus Lumbricidophila sp.]
MNTRFEPGTHVEVTVHTGYDDWKDVAVYDGWVKSHTDDEIVLASSSDWAELEPDDYMEWSFPTHPRVVVREIQHPKPLLSTDEHGTMHLDLAAPDPRDAILAAVDQLVAHGEALIATAKQTLAEKRPHQCGMGCPEHGYDAINQRENDFFARRNFGGDAA